MLAASDAITCAGDAGLVYVSDAQAGIRRRRVGKGFVYRDARDRAVRDEAELARIRKLAIPPAWTDVWICPDPRGHIQAVGRDARGRKQYRYHPRWREVRDSTKYERMLAFAAALPKIRARVERDLRRTALDRDKVLAIVVRLLDTTHIRIGNSEYATSNDSYGLTTMLDRHVRTGGAGRRAREAEPDQAVERAAVLVEDRRDRRGIAAAGEERGQVRTGVGHRRKPTPPRPAGPTGDARAAGRPRDDRAA